MSFQSRMVVHVALLYTVLHLKRQFPRLPSNTGDTRTRMKPDWYIGDVVTHHQQAVTHNQQELGGVESQLSGMDWEPKAKFLAKLATSDTFARIPDSFCQAILPGKSFRGEDFKHIDDQEIR